MRSRKAELESALEDYFVRRCRENELFQTKWGEIGYPDRLILVKGRAIFVELKKYKSKLRKLQEYQTYRLTEYGEAKVFINIDTEDKVEKVIAWCNDLRQTL